MPFSRPFFSAAVASLISCAASTTIAQADTFSDQLCPRAVPKLIDFRDASATKDLKKISDASRAAAEAYKTCESEAVVRTFEEPYVNYDRTRAAQFMVVEGRTLAALGDTTRALETLRDARALADKVVEWQPQSQTYQQSSKAAGNAAARNTDLRASRYHDIALEIRGAADVALQELAARRQPPIPSPAPASSPGHA
jgi:hypothetical protein